MKAVTVENLDLSIPEKGLQKPNIKILNLIL